MASEQPSLHSRKSADQVVNKSKMQCSETFEHKLGYHLLISLQSILANHPGSLSNRSTTADSIIDQNGVYSAMRRTFFAHGERILKCSQAQSLSDHQDQTQQEVHFGGNTITATEVCLAVKTLKAAKPLVTIKSDIKCSEL